MKNIYKGDLQKLTVTDFSIKENSVRILKYNKAVVKKDLLFYRGLANTFISFDYGTRLLDETEAFDVLCTDLAKRQEPLEEPYPSCVYINPSDMQYEKSISNQEFKQLKKSYKKKGSN